METSSDGTLTILDALEERILTWVSGLHHGMPALLKHQGVRTVRTGIDVIRSPSGLRGRRVNLTTEVFLAVLVVSTWLFRYGRLKR